MFDPRGQILLDPVHLVAHPLLQLDEQGVPADAISRNQPHSGAISSNQQQSVAISGTQVYSAVISHNSGHQLYSAAISGHQPSSDCH